MYVKSEQKRIKEQSMGDKIFTRFEDELSSLSIQLPAFATGIPVRSDQIVLYPFS